jgi:hypothetical protein
MNNLREGSLLSSLLTSFLAYQKTGNYSDFKGCQKIYGFGLTPLICATKPVRKLTDMSLFVEHAWQQCDAVVCSKTGVFGTVQFLNV